MFSFNVLSDDGRNYRRDVAKGLEEITDNALVAKLICGFALPVQFKARCTATLTGYHVPPKPICNTKKPLAEGCAPNIPAQAHELCQRLRLLP